jgi:hypothetical protein
MDEPKKLGMSEGISCLLLSVLSLIVFAVGCAGSSSKLLPVSVGHQSPNGGNRQGQTMQFSAALINDTAVISRSRND